MPSRRTPFPPLQHGADLGHRPAYPLGLAAGRPPRPRAAGLASVLSVPPPKSRHVELHLGGRVDQRQRADQRGHEQRALAAARSRPPPPRARPAPARSTHSGSRRCSNGRSTMPSTAGQRRPGPRATGRPGPATGPAPAARSAAAARSGARPAGPAAAPPSPPATSGAPVQPPRPGDPAATGPSDLPPVASRPTTGVPPNPSARTATSASLIFLTNSPVPGVSS